MHSHLFAVIIFEGALSVSGFPRPTEKLTISLTLCFYKMDCAFSNQAAFKIFCLLLLSFSAITILMCPAVTPHIFTFILSEVYRILGSVA